MNFCMTEYLSEGVFGVVVCDNRSASGSGGAGGRSCGNPEEFFLGGEVGVKHGQASGNTWFDRETGSRKESLKRRCF
jgi:hypothetical protein